MKREIKRVRKRGVGRKKMDVKERWVRGEGFMRMKKAEEE